MPKEDAEDTDMIWGYTIICGQNLVEKRVDGSMCKDKPSSPLRCLLMMMMMMSTIR